jgi:hypothetical protein
MAVRPAAPARPLARRESRHDHTKLCANPSCDKQYSQQSLTLLLLYASLNRHRLTDRQTVLKFLPSLLKLDSVDVTPEERAQAAGSVAQTAPIASKPALLPVEVAAAAPQRQSPEQSNVVAAVMLLLRELDEPALMRLREHIDQRLTN